MSNIGINSSAVAFGSVVVAFGAGVGAGYLIFKKRFEEIADAEIQSFKAEYAERMDYEMARKIANDNEAAKALVEDLGYMNNSDDLPREPQTPTTTIVNVFDESPAVPDWNQPAADAERNEKEIYILSRDEFLANEREFDERQFSYYGGDDQLVDERDQVVHDVVGHIGVESLFKFGYGSGDEDIVYVQNETKGCIYEITRTDGKYSEVVLGIEADEAADAELQHSAPRRFRQYND
jgi:hypothetical protein